MRILILILLTLGVGFGGTACSKKKSSSAPATTTNDNDGYYNDNDGDNYNGSTFYDGTVKIYDYQVYRDFLYTSLGYQYNNTYNYNFNCNLDLFNWVFGGQLVDCGSGYSQFDSIVNKPALIELKFLPKEKRNGYYDYPVDGLWVVDPQYNAYEIPFDGYMEELSDGRFLLETGPLALLTTVSGSKVNLNNFDVYYIWYKNGNRYSTKFGNVTIK